MSQKDIFIRRVYEHKGINIIVEIDLLNRHITVVDMTRLGSFKARRFQFFQRPLKSVDKTLDQLEAMSRAIEKGMQVLQREEDKDQAKFAKMVAALQGIDIPEDDPTMLDKPS